MMSDTHGKKEHRESCLTYNGRVVYVEDFLG